MGWWRIDPETGMPLKGGASRLSRLPDFILLNAVPGFDNEDDTQYLGDSPWNMVASTIQEIHDLVGSMGQLSGEEIRVLFLDRLIPLVFMELNTEKLERLRVAIEEMWKDIDLCYEEDWQRRTGPAEKRWIAEYAVRQLLGSA